MPRGPMGGRRAVEEPHDFGKVMGKLVNYCRNYLPVIIIALILGGAGCSIPEVSLLNSIFKKPMVVTFVLCILLVAIGTGFAFTLVMP